MSNSLKELHTGGYFLCNDSCLNTKPSLVTLHRRNFGIWNVLHFLSLYIAVVKPVVNRIISRKQGENHGGSFNFTWSSTRDLLDRYHKQAKTTNPILRSTHSNFKTKKGERKRCLSIRPDTLYWTKCTICLLMYICYIYYVGASVLSANSPYIWCHTNVLNFYRSNFYWENKSLIK